MTAVPLSKRMGFLLFKFDGALSREQLWAGVDSFFVLAVFMAYSFSEPLRLSVWRLHFNFKIRQPRSPEEFHLLAICSRTSECL